MFSAPIYGIKKTGKNYKYICCSLFLSKICSGRRNSEQNHINRFFRLAGALTVKRTWSEGKKIRLGLKAS